MSLIKALTVSLICVLLASNTLAKSVGNPRYASLVIDGKTGRIISQTNAGEYRFPASLTKMMTLYVAFSAVEQGKLSENQLLKVSPKAAGQARTKIGFASGEKISVKDAIQSLIIISANDSSVVLAEALGNGSEQKFAQLMTSTAHKLGMKHTTFMNASGLHHPQQKTTAYDMARLAIALRRDFPQYYPMFDKASFTYKGRTYYSHNHVAKKYHGADGVKTGFIGASGFNLVTSAVREGRYVVAAVFGGQTFKRRDDHMINLLDQAFVTLAKGNKEGTALAIKMPSKITPAQALAMGPITNTTPKNNEALQEIALTPANNPSAVKSELNQELDQVSEIAKDPVPSPQEKAQLIDSLVSQNNSSGLNTPPTATEQATVPQPVITKDFTIAGSEEVVPVGIAAMPLAPKVTNNIKTSKTATTKKQQIKKAPVVAKKTIAKKVPVKTTAQVKAKAIKKKVTAKQTALKKTNVSEAKKAPEVIPVPVLKP